MRQTFAFTSLSTVLVAVFLMLMIPPALCRKPSSCPMMQGQRPGAVQRSCAPAPNLDCCKGNKTPPSPSSEQLTVKHLSLAAGYGLLQPVVSSCFQPEPGRRFEAASSPSEVPLYTLLATLLI